MKNKETLQTAMDRRLSFLDERPSCRTAVMCRIAQEEEPVMKKKVSFGFVFAMVMVLLCAAAVATGLLLSPAVSAGRTADQALEKHFGITEEMQTFFAREEQELSDGAIQVTYTGAGSLEYVLGTYTAVVRDGKAEITWSHDGKDTSGGYDAEAWGIDQLKQMFAESGDEKAKQAFLDQAAAIAEKHQDSDSEKASAEVDENYHAKREADKTAALQARKLSEKEMVGIAREFIINSYELNDEQVARLELYTSLQAEAGDETEANAWYEMVNGKPCFEVEYLLYTEYTTEQMDNNESRGRTEKDGYYKVFVNVEDGTVEEYEYNSAMGGIG